VVQQQDQWRTGLIFGCSASLRGDFGVSLGVVDVNEVFGGMVKKQMSLDICRWL